MQRFLLSKWISLTVVFAITLLAIGCGDDDTPESDSGEISVSTGSLTKAQFIEQANAICTKVAAETQQLASEYVSSLDRGSGTDPATQMATLMNTVIAPAYEKQIDEISALGAPKGDEDEVLSVLREQQRAVDQARARPAKFVQSGAAFAALLDQGRAYGLTACGSA